MLLFWAPAPVLFSQNHSVENQNGKGCSVRRVWTQTSWVDSPNRLEFHDWNCRMRKLGRVCKSLCSWHPVQSCPLRPFDVFSFFDTLRLRPGQAKLWHSGMHIEGTAIKRCPCVLSSSPSTNKTYPNSLGSQTWLRMVPANTKYHGGVISHHSVPDGKCQ